MAVTYPKLSDEFYSLLLNGMHEFAETGTLPVSAIDAIKNSMDPEKKLQGAIGLIGVVDTLSSALGKEFVIKKIPVIGLPAALADLRLNSDTAKNDLKVTGRITDANMISLIGSTSGAIAAAAATAAVIATTSATFFLPIAIGGTLIAASTIMVGFMNDQTGELDNSSAIFDAIQSLQNQLSDFYSQIRQMGADFNSSFAIMGDLMIAAHKNEVIDPLFERIEQFGDHLDEVLSQLGKIYDRQVELSAGQDGNTPGSLADFLSDNIATLIDYSGESSPTPHSAQNPTIFDLSTDPSNLNPTGSDSLGNTTNGEGLLAVGAGYNATMSSTYVNGSGLANTAASNLVADATRPGNHSLSSLTSQVNDVRQTWFNNRLTAGDDTVYTYNKTTGEVVGGVAGSFRYSEAGIPIGITLNAGQAYTDSSGNLKISGGTTYLQFGQVTEKPNGDYDISGARYVGSEQDAKVLAQKSDLNDPNKTPYIDPLTLDSNNDGVLFNANPTNFDLDADGDAEAVSWSAPTDPLLVLDVNDDGRINNGSELVALTDTGAPLNLFGLDGDVNGIKDGMLDANDLDYARLQIWSDRNQDGYASPEERRSLSELGIVSIDLEAAHLQTSTAANPIVGQAGIQGVIATYADGSTRILWDVPFATANSAANPVVTTQYSADIDKISSNGQDALIAMSSLGVAINLQGSGADQAIGSFGNDTLIGTAGNDWLTGGAGSDTFNAGDGADLLIIDADDRQDNIDAGAGIDTVLVADDRGVFLNLAKTHSEVVYGGYGDDVFVGGGADNYFIAGAAGDDLIIGGRADDVLSGEDGSDVIDGGLGDDLIRGHRGEDQLFGGDGNDVLDGGLGDDLLQGGGGNDILIESSGNDTYDGGAGTDLLQLNGELQDYTFTQNGDQSYTLINHTAKQPTQLQVSNIERFSFKRGQTNTAVNFGLNNPLPVNDQISVASGIASYVIEASSLLQNDLDFQHLSSPELAIYWVGDAVGGSVSLDGDQVIFTRSEAYTGALEFNYKVRDTSYNKAPIVTNTSDSSVSGEMKGRVLLLPENAPTDPEYAKQWYLGATGVNKVWQDYTGDGVKVLVLEPSGVFAVASQAADLNHPDLIDNRSADFKDTLDHSNHATLVAGVIGAARNDIGGVGVAYDAVLDSIGIGVDKNAYSYRRDMLSMRNYDVVNNSWGSADLWSSVKQDKLSLKEKEINEEAIETAVSNGRDGLGTIMVFAAGNGRDKGEDAGLSTLTANPYTINVAAINRTGDIGSGFGATVFSSRGANLLLAAPGSNIISSGIQFETANGAEIGNDYQEANGTSLAAPIISGVVALMLEANPNLTYRDVQTILAVTARQDLGDGIQADTVWQHNGSTSWNGSEGMHFSHDFGFGRVDAMAAVRMAENWTSQGQYIKTINAYQSEQVDAVADLDQQVINFNVTDSIDIEQVVVNFRLDHTRWSDLVVTLVSPDDTHSILLDRAGVQDGSVHVQNPTGVIHFDSELMSVHFRGEQSQGNWKLVIEDRAAGEKGSGEIFADLTIIGTQNDPFKRYFLTDEYAGGWVINPDSEKQTELNASALSNGQTIDLSGSSSINGQSLAVYAGIDRLVGTGSDDELIGGGGNETIVGGRGADSIFGGAGNDQLIGGQGNDELRGEAGDDSLTGGIGNDTLYGGAGKDLLVGDEGEDVLYGGTEADVFLIETGNQGVTTIKDFNLDESDSILLRTPELFTWESLNQQVDNGNLLLSFTINQQLREVILEGVSAPLSTEQVRFLTEGQSVSKDETGGYTNRNIISVVPYIESISKEYPKTTGSGLLGNISGGTVIIGDKNGSNVIEQSGSAQPIFHIQEMKWTEGTAYADVLLAGTSPSDSPDQRISQQEWQRALQALGPRVLDGNGGNDEIIGDASDEKLVGGYGNDSLTGGGGNDRLIGGSGDDEFIFGSGHGADTIDDLETNDILHFQGISLQATHLDYRSDRYDELLINTTLETGNGNTIEFSQRLNAEQIGSEQAISLYKTQFELGPAQSVLLDDTTISDGDDVIRQQRLGSKTFNTQDGNDIVFALEQNGLNIEAGEGEDIIYALGGNNTLYGNGGDDRIELFGGAGDDQVFGGSGRDELLGDQGNNKLYGEGDDDYLFGGAGIDEIYGGDGSDRLIGGLGNDILHGGNNNDYFSGGDGEDKIFGEEGDDVLSGNDGADFLYGGIGDDVLAGDEGDDYLEGGSGDDTITTGAGSDTISVDMNSGHDVITGLSGLDTIIFNDMTRDYVWTEVLNNGLQVELSWGGTQSQPLNSLVLNQYNLETKLEFVSSQDASSTQTLAIRDLFNSIGLYPDASFAYLGAFDTQQEGDTAAPVKIVVGSSTNEELYGGPKDSPDEPAYSYVLGRDGDDSLGGGISGSLLDGGAGNDKLLAVNNTVITRDTFRGGIDTLIMPAGIAPEQLVFSRVVNPLELHTSSVFNNFSQSDFEKNIQSLELTEFEEMYALRGSWQENQDEHAFEGIISDFLTNFTKYGVSQGNLYYELTAHFDTLRIQSLDGKLTVDIANYFDEGNLKNNIRNVIFTTAFDNNGNSLDFELNNLLVENQAISTQTLKSAGYFGFGILRDIFSKFSGGTGGQASDIPQSYIAGSEEGDFLEGRVGYDLVDTAGRYLDYWNDHVYDPEIMSSSQYRYEINTTRHSKEITSGFPDYNTEGYAVTFANKTLEIDNSDHARVHAVGLTDRLYGFGGNDFIDAGGAFIEARYMDALGKYEGIIRDLDYIFDSSDYYLKDNLNEFKDIVNGGDGNDRYFYRHGYGGLVISDLDIPGAGARGEDTLDMTEFRSDEVYFHELRENGAFYISNLPDEYDSYDLWVNIEVKGGIEGELQVDRIEFSDRDIQIRDLIEEWRIEGRLLDNSDELMPSVYAAKPSDYQEITRDLDDSGVIVAGSPAGDVIFVESNNSLVNGYEGGDTYYVDVNKITFGVVQMDRKDRVYWSAYTDEIKTYLSDFFASVFFYSPDTPYAGRYKEEWLADGVIPMDHGIFSGDYYLSSIIEAGQLGYFDPLTNDSGYSLDQWVPVSEDNELGIDLLINWRTTNLDGQVTEHHVVLANVMDSWGDRLNGVFDSRIAGYGTMGNDILTSLDSLNVVNDNYITTLDNDGNAVVSVSKFQNKEALSGALYGRGGDDRLIGYARETQVNNADGSGIITTISENDIFYGGTGNDTLEGNNGDDYLSGGEGIDMLFGGEGNDTLVGGEGADNLSGGNGDDTYLIDREDIVFENDGVVGGVDEIRADFDLVLGDYANIENGRLSGNDATLTLIGNIGDNRLQGNGAGSVLTGLGGNDSYVVTHEDDIIIEAVDEGQDTVITIIDILRLANNVENITSNGINLNLFGNNLDNRIIGDVGDNLLDGNTGNDILQGGEGDDEYIVDSQGDTVIESAGQGYDVVWTGSAYTLSEIDNDIEEMRTRSNSGSNLTGNSLNNKLVGGEGDDTLNGAAGTDTLIGGIGNDTYIVDNSGDVVQENADGGTDQVLSSSYFYQLNDHVENLTLIDNGTVGFGNELNNTLEGNLSANLLVGFEGNDRLIGGGGDDTLSGGGGADTLIGGTGTDILSGGMGNDTYIAGEELGSWYFNTIVTEDIIEDYDDTVGNIDTLKLGVNDNPSYGVGYAAFTRSVDDLLVDYSFRYFGYDSEDLYEKVRIKNYFLGNAYQVEKIELPGGVVADTATMLASYGYQYYGSVGDDSMLAAAGSREMYGGDGNDTITGDARDNRIYGEAGDDVLSGEGGNDVLYGGSGNDIYQFGIGYGQDVAYDFAVGAETTSIRLTGVLSTSINTIFQRIGESAISIEFAGDTADELTLYGWWAADSNELNRFVQFDDTTLNFQQIENLRTYTVTAGSDVIYSTSAAGTISGLGGDDKIHGTGDTNIIYGNEGNDALYGYGGDDVLYGGDGDDILDGGIGADYMDGGAGRNVFYVDNSGDTVVGSGKVYTSASNFTMTDSGVPTTTWSDSSTEIQEGGDRNVTANSSVNYIRGNGQSNWIRGLGGNDFIDGGLGGLDIVQGGSGNDTLRTSYYRNGAENQTVLDGGDGFDNLTGNQSNNLLIGGKDSDVIYAGSYTEGDADDSNWGYFYDTGYDIFAYNKGDDSDVLYAGGGAKLTVSLGGGIQYSDLSFSKSGENLILNTGGSDSVTFFEWYNTAGHYRGDTKSVRNLQVIADTMAGFSIGGTDELRNNRIETFDFIGMVNQFDAEGATDNWQFTDDRLTAHMLPGSDTAAIGGDLAYQYGRTGRLNEIVLDKVHNVIGSADFGLNAQTFNSRYGNAADVIVLGEEGDDYISGGEGNQLLVGKTGNDTYAMARGYGTDTVIDNDLTVGNTDTALFLSDISADQIWFQHVGDNLEASIIGTEDKLIFGNWYFDNAYHVEQFKTLDGLTLLDSQVENLVNAMAGFVPPAAGLMTLPTDYQSALAPVLAANWQ